ncbi:MAG TPA: hypothetical protein VMV92_12220 [Streptosporangiaceae bacterium]|nr:hypothetical protein [Streptosporangiaceae bacterium]
MTPAPVAVTCWGELRAERRLPGVLRVLVAGQHAGAAERAGDTWMADWYTAGSRDRLTEHASAEEAVKAVIRSGFARRLGARAGSRVHWSDCARRAARASFRI